MENYLIARCPKCNSIWVCWNWVHNPIEEAVKFNPHMSRDELLSYNYGHECWNCGDDWGGYCFHTRKKVRNGIPYRILRIYGRIKWTSG